MRWHRAGWIVLTLKLLKALGLLCKPHMSGFAQEPLAFRDSRGVVQGPAVEIHAGTSGFKLHQALMERVY